MGYEADVAIGAIDAGVSRIKGLYTKFAQKHEIPYGIIQVSYVLKLHNPVTQKQISEICEMPKQSVNGVIKQLKADKRITVTAGKGDKREKEIRLTPLGEKYIQETLDPFFALNKRVADRIGMDLLNRLSQGLATLGDTLEMEMELQEVSAKWEHKMKSMEKPAL
ncbi:MAG: MarR family transcriptional regulator [Defluviitaleaceae bacterium]|nr:MarR family transcriptional regulator [Defluviitaleaceae bacterium]MCL2239617.1 MarR family transcriptional regulator [Defluviitaleaceae bacterium]